MARVSGHATILAIITDISDGGEVMRRFLPGLKAGVFHAAILMMPQPRRLATGLAGLGTWPR